jgi:hypothetical protein
MERMTYRSKFSVMADPSRGDMFLINTRVYDVVPYKLPPTSDGDPVAVVWCAVYNMSQLEKSN